MKLASAVILKLSTVPSIKNWQSLWLGMLPGAHAAVIACNTNQYHRIAVNIEDAGFEIRDQIIWIASTNIPIVLARKPLAEDTVAANVLAFGTGAINVDACRVEAKDPEALAKNWHREMNNDIRGGRYCNGTASGVVNNTSASSLGRFPANLILTHEAGRRLDEQTGDLLVCGGPKTKHNIGGMFHNIGTPGTVYSDSGGPARFFKCCDTEQELIAYLKLLITPPDGIVLEG